jgi:cephalosporin hydroxylase
MMLDSLRLTFHRRLIGLKTFLVRRLFAASFLERFTVDQFHRLYCAFPKRSFVNTHWMGVQTIKCPLDLWIYQEIIAEQRPDLIIETGTYAGGSALYLAHVCDLVGNGRVLTIDIETDETWPQHPRIHYIHGDSTSPATLRQVKDAAAGQETVLVMLDSDHDKNHVLRELELYSPLVTRGSYLLVEDTHFNGHPIRPEHGPGPMEAVAEFLQGNSHFVVDRSKEKYFLTFNRNGFLQRR